MQTQTLKVEQRKVLGRKVKNLRLEGVLPANIYGKKVKSEAVQVSTSDFEKVYAATGETGLVELTVGGKKRPVLINNVQTDPATEAVLHADFMQVDLKEKVSAQVPVELSGESPAEKEGKGTVVQYIDEIEVEALPRDLPEKFEVDLSGLEEVNVAVYVKDLSFDQSKVKIEEDPEGIIVKVEPPREVEEEAPPTEEVSGEIPEGAEEAPIEAQESKPEKEGSGKKEAKNQTKTDSTSGVKEQKEGK